VTNQTKYCVDDPTLLDLMIADEEGQNPLYKAGPFWKSMADDARAQIRQKGLIDFRGSSSTIGWGFADNVFQDVRVKYSRQKASLIDRLVEKTAAYKRLAVLFDEQVNLARTYETWAREAAYAKILRNPRSEMLLEQYSLNDTTDFGCVDKLTIGEKTVSRHYLKLLDQHDATTENIDYNKATTVFEIGGGFGINAHILIENYPNIRKFIYLDIAPNLYVGTQYLKSFYGDSVRDYRQTRTAEMLEFSPNDTLEILAITPWQIEMVRASVDIFLNAHSFAEIPENAVSNYAQHAMSLMHPDSQIALSTYECPEGSPVIAADRLPSFFPDRNFIKVDKEYIDGGGRTFFYLSSAKKPSRQIGPRHPAFDGLTQLRQP
jgi:putative sugar O-methyltransferase